MPLKYPQVTVRLSGHDGNAFMIFGLCRLAARDAGLTKEELDAFHVEATNGDYEHLLQTVARWFNCE